MPRSGVIPSKAVLAGGILALAALAAYRNSFSGPFVFDDVPSISDNATIRHLWPLWPVLATPSGGLTVSGRPVLNLSFAINHALGGTDVWGYHAANLLIHILAGLTLFGIMRRTLERSGKDLPAAGLGFAVALIWMVHPLQTESVTYIVQRAESLMGLFYLLTLYFFIRGIEVDAASRRVPRDTRRDAASTIFGFQLSSFSFQVFSVAACLLGMATKEVMVSAPVIVFLYDRTFISGSFREAWRRHRALHAGLACTWLVLGWAVMSVSDRGGTAGFGTGIPWSLYLLTQFSAVVHYLRLSVWPHPLVFDYGRKFMRSPVEVFLAVVIVILLIVASLVCFAKRGWGRRAAGFAGIFFFAVLAPTLLVPVATEIVAEHRMYLALAPVLAVAAGGGYIVLGRVLLRPASRRFGGWAILVAVAIVFICLTARRNEIYRSEEAVWSDTVTNRPENERAHYNLGDALIAEGRTPEAIAQYEEALRLKPDYAVAHYNLGNALSAEGRTAEAILQYEEALRLNPDYADAHYGLGYVLVVTGRTPEAIAQFEETLRLKPDYVAVHLNLAIALLRTPGRTNDAVKHLEAVLRLQPGNDQARQILYRIRELQP